MSKQNARRAEERFVYQDDELIEKPFDWDQLRRMFAYMKPYASKSIPVIFLLLIVGAVTKLTVPLLVSKAIDKVLTKPNGNMRLLFIYCGIMLGLYLLLLIANRIRIRMTNVLGQQVIYDMRQHLFSHIQQLSFGFFDKRPAGSVLVRVTNDINSLQDLFTNGVVNSMVDLVQLIGIVVILLCLNFKLALAIMITVPIMFLVSTKLRKHIRRAWQNVRIRQSRINSHLNESIQGIKVTQAYVQ